MQFADIENNDWNVYSSLTITAHFCCCLVLKDGMSALSVNRSQTNVVLYGIVCIWGSWSFPLDPNSCAAVYSQINNKWSSNPPELYLIRLLLPLVISLPSSPPLRLATLPFCYSELGCWNVWHIVLCMIQHTGSQASHSPSIYSTCLGSKVDIGLRPKQESEFLSCLDMCKSVKRDGDGFGTRTSYVEPFFITKPNKSKLLIFKEVQVQVKDWSKFCKMTCHCRTNPGSSEMHKEGVNSWFWKIKKVMISQYSREVRAV